MNDYDVEFIPKYCRKALYGELRRHTGQVFHELARQKECKVEEGHLMPDHVHMLLSIPPKYSVAQVLGFLKGKCAIHIAAPLAADAQLRRPALLGARLSRVHRRQG